LILKFWTRSKLVTNVSDLWPESAVQLGLIGKGPTLSALEFFERLLYKSSKLVSCQTDGIVEGVKKSHPKAETFLFPNGVDLEMFTPQDKDDSLKKEFELPDDHFIVGYGGNHGRSQALSQVLEAAARLKDEKIIFVLFGDGPEKPELQEKVKEMGLENVRFYPSQPRQKMSKIQSLWDLALAPLKNIEIFDGARPSKMFELMAGEIPFIFCGKGEGADIALESGSAKVAPPESYDDLAEAIRAFAKMTPEQRKEMGKQGRKFAAENFDRSKLAVKFLEKLKEVLKK
jgi:glycosyltransferase involved in cell wall biosynthesis